MLDNTEPTEDHAAEGPAESAGAPAKKAARKAPAKRAPRKTPAKKAVAAAAEAGVADAAPTAGPETTGASGPETAGASGPETAGAEGAASAAGSAAAPSEQAPAGDGTFAESGPAAVAPAEAKPKKATRARKAPAKKAAGRAAESGEPSADSGAAIELPTAAPAAAPAATEPAAGESAAAPAAGVPAKRTPRKRVSKAAAAAAAQAATDQAAAAQQSTDQPVDSTAEVPAPEALPAAPSLAAPAVLFQPPTEPAPGRRRRGAKRQPVEPEAPAVAPDASAVEQASAAEQAAFADEVPDSSDIDVDLEPEADIQDEAEETEEAAEDSDTEAGDGTRRRRRRGRRGRGNRSAEPADDSDASPADEAEDDTEADEAEEDHAEEVAEAALSASARRRRRRRRTTGADEPVLSDDDPPNTVVHVRDSRSGGSARDNRGSAADEDGVRGVKGSTRLEAKRQRRRDNRDTGRRRAPILTEAEFLARRESVDRVMAVRQAGDRTQIAVLEDDILVEHYVTRASASSAVGNVYLGRVQNVLPSMEAAFVDIGRGRNGVLYAGEVNWDVAGLEGKARSIENALNAGDLVLVQVTKDPIGHKGARLTSQISLPGRFVVYVPGGGMTGISRKLPDVERSRLKAILKKVVPDEAGVIVRTAAEGASEQDLISDVERLKTEWESISAKTAQAKQSSDGPCLVHGEPDLAIRVVRDIFNDDFSKLVVAGSAIHRTINDYVRDIAPDLADRIKLHTAESDLFRDLRVDEQLAKALDRKVWLPSGGSLVIDRTEAMTVVDVNTGKYTGSGGNLEQTVTRNNLEAAEEIVRQLRLRDIGGIVVIDFIDMVLESNRELVLRRLTECLGRDRTKHQVAEVTSLGLVQMTRKRVGEGLLEAFSEPCSVCNGRGVVVHLDAIERKSNGAASSAPAAEDDRPARGRRGRKAKPDPVAAAQAEVTDLAAEAEKRRAAASAVAAIAAATTNNHPEPAAAGQGLTGDDGAAVAGRTPDGAAADSPAPAGRAVAHRDAPSVNGAAVIGGDAGAGVNGAAADGVDGATGPGSVPESAGAALPPRRRRRVASRPAGPPVPVSGTEG